MKSISSYNKAKIARTIARKVDLLYNEDDFRVAMMGSLGMSTKAICEATGLSHCQVTYRLNKGSVKRSDYRDGNSEVARAVIGNAKKFAATAVRNQLLAKLKALG